MTRDEAIAILRSYVFRNEDGLSKDLRDANTQCIAEWIGGLAALGVLELDEPPSNDSMIAAVISDSFSFDAEPREMEIFRRNLAASGLKIVEADK